MIVLAAVILAFVAAVVTRLDHRYPLVVGLVALGIMGVFVVVDQRDLANLCATVAFFLLAFGTGLAFVDAVRQHAVGRTSPRWGLKRIASRLRHGR